MVWLTALLFGSLLPQSLAPIPPSIMVSVDQLHSPLSGEVEQQLITVPETGKVTGIQIKVEDGVGKKWWFTYPYRKKVTDAAGRNTIVRGYQSLFSPTGEATIPIRGAGEWLVRGSWEKENGEEGEIRFYLSVPRLQLLAEKKNAHWSEVRAHIRGQNIEGTWYIALADAQGRILHIYPNQSRIPMKLPKGKYLIQAIFKGTTNGAPFAMVETRQLHVERETAITQIINYRYDDQFINADKVMEQVKAMKSQKRIYQLSHRYASKRSVGVWISSWGLIIFGTLLYRYQLLVNKQMKTLNNSL